MERPFVCGERALAVERTNDTRDRDSLKKLTEPKAWAVWRITSCPLVIASLADSRYKTRHQAAYHTPGHPASNAARYKSARGQRRLQETKISSPRANILRKALARLRVTQEPQPEEPTAAQEQRDMAAILGDDPLAHTCGFLDARELDVLRTCGRRTRDVAGRGSVWEPVCARRWRGRRQLNEWRNEAGNEWRAHYALREREILRKRVPIFAMSAYLEVGRRTDLHFFEPRYKWLIRIAAEDHGGLFVFCTNAPLVHPRSPQFSWVCEARNVQLLPDGRANLSVFPVARCLLRKLWREPVPDVLNAPQLTLADVEELPLCSAPPPPVTEDDDDSDYYSDSDNEDGRMRLSPSHRELLELLVENPGAMEELGLTHERVQELLLRGQEPASDTDDTLDV